METIQVNSELEKKLVFNIIQYLNSFTSGASESGLNVDTEGLEVAVQCISAAFNLDAHNEEQKAQYSIEPLSLPHIFGLGLAGKQQLEAYAQQQMAHEAPQPVQSKVPKELEEKFKSFLSVLEKKDFFKGTEPGSDEHRQRMALAEDKFLARAQAPAAAPTAQPAVSVKSEIDPQVLEEAERLKAQGNSCLSNKQVKEAIEFYDKAINLNPNNSVYYANRAAAHSSLGNHEKAIFDCKSAIDLDPKYSKAYSRLGFSLFSLGKYKEAIELGYKKCLELDPTNATAKESLLLAQEKLEEEERLKQRAAAVPPSSPTPSPVAGPGGLPEGPAGFGQLLNSLSTPEMQSAMQNLAQQMPDLGSGSNPFAGAGGGMGGGGGAGGQPSFAELLNNPTVMNMAQQVMSSPAFNQILQNPAFMNMAQGMMQNPSQFENMFRGMGGGGQGGEPKEEGDK